MASELGRLIRGERMKRGLSLRGLAREVDKSPAFIVSLEKNAAPPAAAEETLTSIARALGLNPDRLITLAGKTPSDVVPANELDVELYRRVKRLTTKRKKRLLEELNAADR